VVPAASCSFEEQDWQQVERDLNLAINYRLDIGYQLHERTLPQSSPPCAKSSNWSNKVSSRTHLAAVYIIEVYARQSRHLYQLTQTLGFRSGIHRAKSPPSVEQQIDIFYVTTRSGDKLTNEETKEKISMTLMRIIGVEEAETRIRRLVTRPKEQQSRQWRVFHQSTSAMINCSHHFSTHYGACTMRGIQARLKRYFGDHQLQTFTCAPDFSETKPTEIFGSNVFSDKVMKERLPKHVYKSLKNTIAYGEKLDASMPTWSPNAMKDWAIEKKCATHFTHVSIP
jgi:hypothetical protein